MRSRINIGPFIFFIIILLLWQCKGKEEVDIRMITFQGSGLQRFSDSYTHFSALDSLGYGSLMIRNGELVNVDDFFFSLRRDLPDTLHIQKLDSLIYINGKLVGISISEDSPPISFFNQLSKKDINNLRTIQFEMPINDSVRPYLKKIASLNPVIDIVFSYETDSLVLLNRDLHWLSNHFQPRALLLGNETDSATYSNLVKFPSLNCLLIGLPLHEVGYLPRLPHLREIILLNTEDSSSIDSRFFRENLDLESLTIIAHEELSIDWTSLDNLKNLKHLYIESDSIFLNDIYKYHPQLKSLHLGFGKEGNSFSDVFKKNKLKWLSLNTMDSLFLEQKPKVFQDSFPDLEYLEFLNNDTLLDYRDFKNIKKLKYLVVNGEVGLDSTLHHLDHLDYLSLPYDFLKDSVNLVKVKKALPNTIITPNSGVCLGSGWLLLLIPLAGLWFYLLKPTKRISGND